jgi:hypothetical protein
MVFEEYLSWCMAGTYVISIYISYDVLLEACLLDVLVTAFGMLLSYILGHELMT